VTRTFGLLATGAVAVLVVLGVMRLVASRSGASPESMVPFLIAAAALCVAALSSGRRPTIAWLALIVAFITMTIDLAAFGRDVRQVVSLDAWRWISIVIVLTAVAATSTAAAYAADPARRLGRWVAPFGVAAISVVFVIGVWALATPDSAVATVGRGSPLGDLGLVTRAFLVTTAALTAIGVFGDLRPAADRASTRLAVTGDRKDGARGEVRYAVAWLRTLVDELTPGRAHERRAARAERARLARELHAAVVPDLRRVISEADRIGSVEQLAASLRQALAQVEAMMESRDAVGLEIGGLVPALESLAERVEERSDVRVTIDVVDDPAHAAGSPPPDVQVAALRVASLALDNVTRHASKASVRLTVASGAKGVRLSIEDDGPGLPSDLERAAGGGRGLADMATEAALCGATLRSGPGAGDSGTVIAFHWPRS
jgi:signal transduction histidine kinase